MVRVTPGRQEQVKGVTEPITVHRLLEIKSSPEDMTGCVGSPARHCYAEWKTTIQTWAGGRTP